MFTLNLIVADDVLATTGMTQEQLDQVVGGIQQAATLWSRYIDGNNAVIDLALGFSDLSGSTLAQAGSSFFTQGGGDLQSEVINELNGQSGLFGQDGTFRIDLPKLLNDRFFFSDSLDFYQNPGASGQIDFLTLAAHELGHVLGFLSLSFDGFVVNNQFTGANAVAANGGSPVQLADGVHTDGDDLLSPSISSNLREPLTPVHIAILQDLGVPIALATAAADTLYGFNSSNDAIYGEGGNDTLLGLSGDDFLSGESLVSNYDPFSGQIYRLYQATLAREPDLIGLNSWIENLRSGQSLDDIASNFIESTEFNQIYGNTEITEFVTLLYDNVLNREPDSTGFENWVNNLTTGTLSRQEVVTRFSESIEFVNKTYLDTLSFTQSALEANNLGQVYRLYNATLNREPDLGGFDFWVDNLSNEMSLLDATSGFVNSTEFQLVYGDTTDEEFVTLLYNNVLDREPDPSGLEFWTDLLATSKLTQEQVTLGFSESQEHLNNTNQTLTEYIRTNFGINDLLNGNDGNDILFGGAFADVFEFNASDAGENIIVDFEIFDYLSLVNFGYTEADDVLDNITQKDGNVVFNDQNITITLLDKNLNDLNDNNFLFDNAII